MRKFASLYAINLGDFQQVKNVIVRVTFPQLFLLNILDSTFLCDNIA